jgi:hypothetical protein
MATLLVTELRADGSPITTQSMPIPNSTVQVLAPDANGIPVLTTVPVTSTTGGILNPNFAVLALNEWTAFVILSGGPALVATGSDPRPSRNSIPVPADESSITLPTLGRRLAVL